MKDKIIISIVILVVVAIVGYFLTRPIGKTPAKNKMEKVDELKTGEPIKNNSLSNGDKAFQEFLNSKKENKLGLQELDNQLEKLSKEFPSNYRFPLERVRGEAKIKGLHSHNEEFELLANAAQTSIECNCGDAEKMLNDLQQNSRNKANGFWKLSTHPKQWNPIMEALKQEDVEALEKINDSHH